MCTMCMDVIWFRAWPTCLLPAGSPPAAPAAGWRAAARLCAGRTAWGTSWPRTPRRTRKGEAGVDPCCGAVAHWWCALLVCSTGSSCALPQLGFEQSSSACSVGWRPFRDEQPRMQGRQHELRCLERGAPGAEGLAGEAVRHPRSVSRWLCLLGSQAVDRVVQHDVDSQAELWCVAGRPHCIAGG